MSSKSRKPRDLDSSLQKLCISPDHDSKRRPVEPIADSWEEAASSSSSSTSISPSTPSTPKNQEIPGPPPPTPISPASTHARKKSTDWSTFPTSYAVNSPITTVATTGRPLSDASSEKRPEKSNAAAGRMIAGALGVKAPKKTEEGKAYERAVNETERKRRERMKEEDARVEREKEEARKAIWES